MDFKQLRAFLTVADTGNVTRAAEMLNLVQPAVSRQLRLLEDDIGTELFERERYGMVLTEAGQSLVGYARRVMLELDRARAEVSKSVKSIGGLVTLGLLPSTCELLSVPLVRRLAKDYPGIRVRITMGYAGTLAQWLETGEVDAALLYGAERTAKFQSKPLIEEALFVFGPPSAKLGRDHPVPLASLAGRPLILPSQPHGIRTLVEHACAVSHVELTIAAETNAMSVQKSLAIQGLGWTILPAIAVAEDVRRRLASAAPICDPEIKRTIILAAASHRAAAQHVRFAVETLVHCIKDEAHRGAWRGSRWLGQDG